MLHSYTFLLNEIRLYIRVVLFLLRLYGYIRLMHEGGAMGLS